MTRAHTRNQTLDASGRPAGFSLAGQTTSLSELVAEIWRSRGLLALLARKEFFVRYRRASFGALWAVALPLVQAMALAAVIGRFVRYETGDNFVLYVFSGTLAWWFFAASVGSGATAIIDNADMSSKVYISRALFPLTAIGTGLYGLGISIAILVVMTALLAGVPGLHLLWYLPAVALLVALSTGLTLLTAALQVYFRDVKYIVQAVLVPMFYVTPIFYPLSAVDGLRRLVEVNPMTGVVLLFRAGTFGSSSAMGGAVAWTVGWSVVLLAGSGWMYRRYDRVMTDLL